MNVPELNANEMEMGNGMKFFHVYTRGLEDDVIFRDRGDYVAGMNYVPVSIKLSEVHALAFVLMSNHFHFILCGTKESAEKFIDMYKRLVSRYVSNKYGVRKILRSVETVCREVTTEEELKRLIAYALNNPVKAGVNCLPQNYEWGTGRCYFSNYEPDSMATRIHEMTVRERCRTLRSQVELPKDIEVNASGYIDPRSYVKVAYVENLFRSPKSMGFFLNQANRAEGKDEGPVAFSDSLVLASLSEILEKRYESLSLTELSREIRGRIMKDLRRQFNCSAKQLARIMGLPLREVVNQLEK